VFKNSFFNPKVKYPDASLEIVYRQLNLLYRDFVFRSESCSKEFITRHFDEEFERCVKTGYQPTLINIVSNPNTPIILIQNVISSQTAPVGVTRQAKIILRKRQLERIKEPPPTQSTNSLNGH